MIFKLTLPLLLFVFFHSRLAKSETTSTPTAASAPILTVDPKLELAKNLMKIIGFDKLILDNTAEAERAFEKWPVTKDEKTNALNKKIYSTTAITFKNKKSAIVQTATDGLQKEIAKRYTEAELKYLIQLTAHPLFQNFRNFLDSDSYFNYVNQPVFQARSDLKEATKQLSATQKK